MNEEPINKIYNGDIMTLLKQLPDKCVDMVYSDPDYNIGIKYNANSYTTSFESYISWYTELAKESMRVLKDEGNIFFINYPRQNAYLWVHYLDKACYEVSEYVWVYNSNVGHSPRKFTRAHRSILHCRKNKESKWYKSQVAEPYKNPTDKRIINNIANGSSGRMPYSWLYFDLVKNVSKDKTMHSCQIPTGLVEKLIKASTIENDIVLIHFAGSGNEIFTCKKLNRNFISAEIDVIYYQMINERLKINGDIPDKYKLKKEIQIQKIF
ncbi:DNA-methyltransferase [Candidatus Magnetomonas plexicatena]|uniref:DNA-methyltransferase n=1 Tax=Candidatus Magnetomonas plexicatena TaxID=2552947 RepID=UPI00110433C1|nr:site-specific DNA-methyltransferase [Nitrospirales bacterium LBB_01]